jgi:hypothetical protein
MKTYQMLDDEANPRVQFDEDEFLLQMPFWELVGENEVSIEKIEINFLRKQEILDNFMELFDCIQEDIEESGELAECYEFEDEDKFITYTIYPIPEDGKIELAFSYAVNQGVYQFPLYTADYDFKNSTGIVLEELVEGSHVFFHEELMELTANYKELLNCTMASALEE